MREARHAAWQLVFVCLLAWPCCQASVTSPAGAGCNSEHLTVSAAAGSPIAGCYRKTDGSVGENGGLLYINTNGGAVDGGVGRTVAMWSLDNRASDSRWAIGEVHGKHASRICVSGSPMQGWECAGGAVIPNMVTCGCDQEVAGKFGAAAGGSEAAASGNGGGGEKLGGRIRGGRSNTRHSVRGADGRDEGAVFAAAADGGAVVSRALSDGGDFHSFWKWVVVAFGIAGLIVLCLIGWYIRNPFFCQKEPPAPPADPTVVRDDVAPQAPKVAFQPWGASAPPK